MHNIYYQLLLVFGYVKRLLFFNQYTAGDGFKLYATGGIIGGKDKIKIGNQVTLFGWLISDGGNIMIGDNTVIHKGTIIRSMNVVTIGSHCDIGTDSHIQDHNSMSLHYLHRRNRGGEIINKPVKIGDDVWIGRGVTILKGVTIGDRSIIGTNATVTNDVPQDSLAVGNPARIAKSLHYK